MQNLKELEEELSLLKKYPREDLERIIKEIGFSCTCCGKCCTKAFNSHVFLLSEDANRLKSFSPESMIPAPDFPYSDPSGNFSVSGTTAALCRRTSAKGRRCGEKFRHRQTGTYGNA